MDHGAAERVQTDLSSSPIDDRSIEGLAVTPTAISTAASSDSIFETIERRGGGRPSAWPSALSMLLGDQPSGVTSGSTEPLSCRWTHSEQGNSQQEPCSEFTLHCLHILFLPGQCRQLKISTAVLGCPASCLMYSSGRTGRRRTRPGLRTHSQPEVYRPTQQPFPWLQIHWSRNGHLEQG